MPKHKVKKCARVSVKRQHFHPGVSAIHTNISDVKFVVHNKHHNNHCAPIDLFL